jgi:hypothetical protein
MDVGNSIKSGMKQIFDLSSCKIVLHKNFNCSNVELLEMRAMPNMTKSKEDVFQFLEKVDISDGDVIEKVITNEYWKVYKTYHETIGDTYIFMWAYVKKIDVKGNYLR